MKPAKLIIFVIMTCAGCQRGTVPNNYSKKPSAKQETVTVKATAGESGTIQDTISLIADTTKLLSSEKIKHIFSDFKDKDLFEINLYGDTVITGTIVFQIFSWEHKVLYKHIFSVQDMLIDYNELSILDRTDTIRNRMKHFFDEKNFLHPAISKNETLESSFTEWTPADEANWKAVKADPTAVTFVYNYGYESTYGIAYAKTKQKVVGVFYSD